MNQARFARESQRHRFTARRATVQEVARPLDGVARITFGGPDFADFASTGPADHVRIYFPDDDGVLVAPEPDPSGEGIIRPEQLTINRDYTPLDPRTTADGGAFVVDFLEHADPGPATRWAFAAEPGDELVIVGPRGSRGAPAGVDGLVLIVDSTSLPAASRWIAEADAGPTSVLATLERDEDWLIDYLGTDDFAELRVVRPDPDGAALLAAAMELPIEPDDFVFAAGEATSLARVRRFLLGARGLPPEQVAITGYWRRGVVAFDHHTPLDD